MKYALIVVGYKRINGLSRLLNSLNAADYFGEEPTLIISIDNSGDSTVELFAKDFRWLHGEKRIKTYFERQGLREHILKCGDMVDEFDAVAILEDDLYVSPGFFAYMKATVEKYYYDDRIAGISLYNYCWNENVGLPFQAAKSEYDGYFIQTSQSWGQIWMRDQWRAFREWYKDNAEEIEKDGTIPLVIANWPASSWKKYHVKYCVTNNKYMFFPYESVSTCFSEIGEHCKRRDTFFQVPLLYGIKKNYILPELDDVKAVKYDVYFERILNRETIGGISTKDISVDLYGSKININKRYLLTTKVHPYLIVQKYGLCLKPQEENVLRDIEGDDIFLYDTSCSSNNRLADNKVTVFRYRFDLYEHTRCLVCCIVDTWSTRIKNMLTRKK